MQLTGDPHGAVILEKVNSFSACQEIPCTVLSQIILVHALLSFPFMFHSVIFLSVPRSSMWLSYLGLLPHQDTTHFSFPLYMPRSLPVLSPLF